MENIKYKKSKQRERILEILKMTTTHPTASLVYDMLKLEFPDLSLGTVYRNLRILQDQGLITHLDFGSTFDRFDGNMEPHYHFICDKCAAVIDLALPAVKELDSHVEIEIPGKVLRHRMEFFGLCQSCIKK